MAYLDKFGTSHNKQEHMEYANICYDMTVKLMDPPFNMDSLDALLFVSTLMDNAQEGKVARDAVKAFITLTELHQLGGKYDKKD